MVAMLRQAAITSAANPPAENSRFITNHALLPAGGVAGRTPIDGPAIQAMITFGVPNSPTIASRGRRSGPTASAGSCSQDAARAATAVKTGMTRKVEARKAETGGPMNIKERAKQTQYFKGVKHYQEITCVCPAMAPGRKTKLIFTLPSHLPPPCDKLR